MEGRTVSRYLKESYGSIANKALIDYKRLRLDINSKLIHLIKNSSEIKGAKMPALTERNLSYIDNSVAYGDDIYVEGSKNTLEHSHGATLSSKLRIIKERREKSVEPSEIDRRSITPSASYS